MFANTQLAFETRIIIAQLDSGWQLQQTECSTEILAISGPDCFGLRFVKKSGGDAVLTVELVDCRGCSLRHFTGTVSITVPRDAQPREAVESIRGNLIEPYLEAVKPTIEPFSDAERSGLLDAEAAIVALNGHFCTHRRNWG